MPQRANTTGIDPATCSVVPSLRAETVTVTGRAAPFSVSRPMAVRVTVRPAAKAGLSRTGPVRVNVANSWSGVTGGVITAAGVVLAATFAVLAQLPSVSLTEVGTAVALGVLLDTLVVRTVVVPAMLLWAADRIWWPSRRGDEGP
jgi:uncharacterized membrane protein YdfJ with MMPL/SSD domain